MRWREPCCSSLPSLSIFVHFVLQNPREFPFGNLRVPPFLPWFLAMSGYLPQEVLFNIFLDLPPKTLVLCSCVSKSWRSVIASPTFFTAHLNQSLTCNRKLLILRRYYGNRSKQEVRYSLHFDTETLDLYQELKFPFVNRNGDFEIVGFCNGLVCFLGLDLLLWNPSIQRAVVVPRTSDILTIYGVPDYYALGFGFDSRANDYKVVRLLYFEDKTPLIIKDLLKSSYMRLGKVHGEQLRTKLLAVK